MKNVLQKMLIASILTALVACPTGSPPTPKPPFVSVPGTITGTPVTKTIDSTGGTLSSADGSITINVLEGTFSIATQVSVQPVTNPTSPWGAGTGFRFVGFTGQLKPITIKLKFEGDPPKEALGVAVQDTLGAWRGFKQFVMDETTKTINVTLGANTKSRVSTRALDYTDIYVYSHFFVFPRSASVKVNKTQDFTFEGCDMIDPNVGDDLAPLRQPEPSNCLRARPEDNPQTWAVNGVTNGNNTLGKIVADPIGATFTAPPTVPSSNPVQVSVTVHYGNKTLLTLANVTIVGAGFKVVGDFTSVGYPVCSGFIGIADMTDHVEFVLAETGSSTGFPYVIEVLDNKISKNQNFRASEYAAGGTVTQNSPSEVLNAIDGNGEFKSTFQTLSVTLKGVSWTGACTLTYPGQTFQFPAGESIASSASFEFKTNAFVNNTQTVKGEDSSGFGSWEFTITKL
jgi:hypothetical protein